MITLSMAIGDKTLRDEVHCCLRGESIHIDSEQEQTGDLASFTSSRQRAAPPRVLIFVSITAHPPQEVIEKLRLASPDSMIVALNTTGATGPVLECFRAGADEYLFPPLAEGLKKALKRRQKEKTEIGERKCRRQNHSFPFG